MLSGPALHPISRTADTREYPTLKNADAAPSSPLDRDRLQLEQVLDAAVGEAKRFLEALDGQPVAHRVEALEAAGLPERGLGTAAALEDLQRRYTPWISGSAGPRYFAFVTGGTTPAALAGDWLATAYDQNGSDAGESSVRQLSLDAVAMFGDLLSLPSDFTGVFVSGATMSSFVGLAMARQWVGKQRGVDVAAQGLVALGDVPVLSGTAHSSIYKGLAMLGLGRQNLRTVATLPGREAVDVAALESALAEVGGPAVVVANAGTVNSTDFDDLEAISKLRRRYDFWLHVDGAFGAIAACSERYGHLLKGLEGADSLTVDAHKWLNVPYDSALIFSRHLSLQGEVFRSMAPYLEPQIGPDTFLHLTPENSQRWRALPVWMTLVAYGRQGYAEIVERCCELAQWLGRQIEKHDRFRLLAPVRLNGLCFTLVGDEVDSAEVQAYLDRLRDDGTAFLTPTQYAGQAAMRVSIVNWRTRQEDVEATWRAMLRCLV